MISTLFGKKHIALLQFIVALFAGNLFAGCASELPTEETYFIPVHSNDCVCGCEWDNFSFHAALLYWEVDEDGLQLGRQVTTDSHSFREHEKNPQFNYDVGFRLGATYFLPCDGWDVTLDWTHFYSAASTSGRTQLNNVATPSFSLIKATNVLFDPDWDHYGPSTPDRGHGKAKLMYDTIDLELGRLAYLSECIMVRPFIAARLANIQQHYHASYNADRPPGITLVLPPTPNNYDASTRASNDFLGFGALLGLDMDWKLGCGFSIVARADAGVLYGRFDCHTKEKRADYFKTSFSQLTNQLFAADWHFHKKYWQDRWLADFALGIRYEDTLCCCDQTLPYAIALTWEQHIYYRFNQYRFSQSLGPTNSLVDAANLQPLLFTRDRGGDLAMHGLTISFETQF